MIAEVARVFFHLFVFSYPPSFSFEKGPALVEFNLGNFVSHFDVIFHRPICRCHESSFQWPPNAGKLLVKRCKSFRSSVFIRREPLVWLMLVSILKHLIGTSVSLVT